MYHSDGETRRQRAKWLRSRSQAGKSLLRSRVVRKLYVGSNAVLYLYISVIVNEPVCATGLISLMLEWNDCWYPLTLKFTVFNKAEKNEANDYFPVEKLAIYFHSWTETLDVVVGCSWLILTSCLSTLKVLISAIVLLYLLGIGLIPDFANYFISITQISRR